MSIRTLVGIVGLIVITAMGITSCISPVSAAPGGPGTDQGQQAPPCHGKNNDECRPDPQPEHGQDCKHSDDHVCNPATPAPEPTTVATPEPSPTNVPTTPPTTGATPAPTSVPTVGPTPTVPGTEATPSTPSTATPVVEIRAPDASSEGRVLSTEPEVVRTPEQLPTVLPKAGDNISSILLMLAIGGAILVLLGAALRRQLT